MKFQIKPIKEEPEVEEYRKGGKVKNKNKNKNKNVNKNTNKNTVIVNVHQPKRTKRSLSSRNSELKQQATPHRTNFTPITAYSTSNNGFSPVTLQDILHRMKGAEASNASSNPNPSNSQHVASAPSHPVTNNTVPIPAFRPVISADIELPERVALGTTTSADSYAKRLLQIFRDHGRDDLYDENSGRLRHEPIKRFYEDELNIRETATQPTRIKRLVELYINGADFRRQVPKTPKSYISPSLAPTPEAGAPVPSAFPFLSGSMLGSPASLTLVKPYQSGNLERIAEEQNIFYPAVAVTDAKEDEEPEVVAKPKSSRGGARVGAGRPPKEAGAPKASYNKR